MNRLKIFSLLWLFFLLPPTTPTSSPFLTLNQLSISGLDLKNIRLFLLESSEHQTEISWSISRLGAEEQFDDVTINDIYCHRAIFTIDSVTCKQGHGTLSALGWYETEFDFSYRLQRLGAR
ncbi:MAG: hypothetical protein QF470_03230 [Methylococcales bacterium]|jgi:hypothetical protein|nr:hypothetical protein [Methylococcales bacterium]